MKDGVFDAHSNDGKRGPRVEEGKRTGSQGSCQRGGDRLRRGQRRDEAESRISEDQTREKNTKEDSRLELMERTAVTAEGLGCQGSGWSGNSALSHSSWGDRVFPDHD